MGSLEKLSEAIAVVGGKQEAIQNVMKVMMSEWGVVEETNRTIQDLSARAVGELESKQKHAEAVVESVKASYAMLNSKKRWLEDGLKKLDEKHKFVREDLEELEQGKGIMRTSIDQQFKELALKQQQVQDLSESLKMTPGHVEERKNELDLMEKDLEKRKDEMEEDLKKRKDEMEEDLKKRKDDMEKDLKKRKDEMDSRQKQLEARELEAHAEEQRLKKMQQEMDAGKKRLEDELESRKASFVDRESFIVSKEKALLERALKQKISEEELDSRKTSLIEREFLIISKERDVELREKLLEKKENIVDLKPISDPGKNELDLMEKDLKKRKDQIDSKQNQLEARELEARAEEQRLKIMQKEMDAEKTRFESRKASFVEREILVASKEKILLERERELALKQKNLETELESQKASLVGKESLIICKELNVESRDKPLEQRENLMQSKALRDSRENTIQQPESYAKTKHPKEIRLDGYRRGFGDGSAGEALTMGSQRRDGKRPCSGDGVTEHKARRHPQQSGSDDELKTKTSAEVVILDDSYKPAISPPGVRMEGNRSGFGGEVLVQDWLRHDSKRQRCADGWTEHIKAHPHPKNPGYDNKLHTKTSNSQVRVPAVGEMWTCFDAIDGMPRTCVKILGMIGEGPNARIQVERMRPRARYPSDAHWIWAGLPVGCGDFEPSGTSMICRQILFQPIFSDGNPYVIVPYKGETWAIYKDWDMKAWSWHPDIHGRCEYDIVEILSYPRTRSSSIVDVQVAYLDKVSGCSFQRRSKDSFEIESRSLYRFSHKVHSFGNSGVFQLDHRALPPALL